MTETQAKRLVGCTVGLGKMVGSKVEKVVPVRVLNVGVNGDDNSDGGAYHFLVKGQGEKVGQWVDGYNLYLGYD